MSLTFHTVRTALLAGMVITLNAEWKFLERTYFYYGRAGTIIALGYVAFVAVGDYLVQIMKKNPQTLNLNRIENIAQKNFGTFIYLNQISELPKIVDITANYQKARKRKLYRTHLIH